MEKKNYGAPLALCTQNANDQCIVFVFSESFYVVSLLSFVAEHICVTRIFLDVRLSNSLMSAAADIHAIRTININNDNNNSRLLEINQNLFQMFLQFPHYFIYKLFIAK